MLPIDEDNEKLPIIDDTVRVSVCGTVAESSKENASFCMYTKQYVCGQLEEIAIRAILNKNTKWKNPLQVLPYPNSLIGFDGVLDKFEIYNPDNSSHKVTRAVVAVQDVTFLLNVDEGGTNTDKTVMKDKIKNRWGKKKNVTPSSVQTTPVTSQGSSVPLPSQKSLGK